MLFPQVARRISQRRYFHHRRHFPQRPLPARIRVCRVAQQALFRRHRLLRGMLRMSHHLDRLRCAADCRKSGRSARHTLSKGRCGARQTQNQPCHLHEGLRYRGARDPPRPPAKPGRSRPKLFQPLKVQGPCQTRPRDLRTYQTPLRPGRNSLHTNGPA
jgi:hypothetical protein